MNADDLEKLPYRPCVGVMLANPHGKVFVGQRTDRHKDAWQMPQGGVDKGEDPRAAALRELREETGVTASLVEIIAETKGWVSYDLPLDIVGRIWKGKYRGQTQKWYLMRFNGSDDQVDLDTHHPEFGRWKWQEPDCLVDEVVDFKRAVYQQVVQEFLPHLRKA